MRALEAIWKPVFMGTDYTEAVGKEKPKISRPIPLPTDHRHAQDNRTFLQSCAKKW
jgi:hypothetical protein